MLTVEQFRELATRLIAKTKAAQVMWRAGQEHISNQGYIGRELEVEFPSSILTVGYFAPAGNPAGGVDYVLLTISDKQGAVVDQRRIGLGSPEWELAVSLCTHAYAAVFGANTLEEVFRLVKSDEPIGTPSKSNEVFAAISGKWRVNFTLQGKPGTEEAIIDDGGNYYLTIRPAQKHFRLVDAEFTKEPDQFQFTKVFASGQRAGEAWDTELLTLSPDRSKMQGVSVRFGHLMTYSRIG